MEKFVTDAALHLEAALKIKLREPKSGRIYDRGDTFHQASAPDEAPATDTGNLAESITVEQDSTLEAVIGTNTRYALDLEEGTPRVEPRPLWGVTLEEQTRTLENLFEKRIGAVR